MLNSARADLISIDHTYEYDCFDMRVRINTRIRDGSESARTQAGFDLSPSPSTASISNLLGVTNASEAEKQLCYLQAYACLHL